MTTLMQASRQWASRPDDERYTSLDEMLVHFRIMRCNSLERVLPAQNITAIPDDDNRGLHVHLDSTINDAVEASHVPTNYAFGQLSLLAGAPAGYLRSLPAPLAADCVNYGLKLRNTEDCVRDVGILLEQNGENVLRAATGPKYGRIWNADVVEALTERFGDGVTGDWRVPGEFGKAVVPDKKNTTLFASDRDMFVFLADEENRIEVPDRRNGLSGSLARGFFMWNSEVGSKTFGLGTFLFDYVCCNRIVWGAEHYAEVKIRHTSGAPDRFLEQMKPALEAYSNASASSVTQAIEDAKAKRLDDKLDDFLANRFGKRMVAPLKAIHEAEEGRPIETLWDASVAVSAHARAIPHQDQRVDLERKAGDLVKLAS